ncbi:MULTISPECIES: ATP-dependent acyl-CoA ligase [unclassified Variovorax]|mgnify:CR=1 FL=1|jgi:crotonobetaine/carnitine-CoA ligase|uniref:ATP-dependent acyl-CoA ligase n=1 Tax=unclassified Variovorax TaxID=663243 RepID=UPI000F7DEE8B|nr:MULTISPECIES: ATP-dependent acyl-CoA ligase [unclassified Variovorax]RSZ46149.1 ATP-dependent acyl-CoA ligase [Variovorax sp. 553]RSZ46395.1 ATP-dependent acyl-CoA ligase [Variovorax sp. 679]
MTSDPRAVPPAQRTLPAMLQRQAALFGSRGLLRIAGCEWAHGDAAQAAAVHAGALAAAGVAHGDRIAVMCGNRIEFLESFLGAGWLGASMVPVNTASMGPQIEYFLANSEAKLLVIEAGFLERLATADLARTALREIWIVGEAATAWRAPEGVRAVAYPGGGEPVEAAAVQPGDPLAILYTSGTTGPAKGVICPHAQYFWWGVNSAEVLGVGADDVLCTTLPLFHINALNTFAQAALTGAQVVFESRFSASGFWPTMRSSGATVVYLLGAMVPILLAQPEGPGERDHRVRTGLGPGVPSAAGAAFKARTGVSLLEGYGSTETNFAIATAPDSPRGGVMGWLRPGFQARVADEDDVELPPDEAGELLLRADEPFAFASGYFNMPEKTVEAWRNLWFHTGDRVVRDADGAFRFVDRIKDAIRRRGENISSFEVEQVLLSHPGVASCAVYPVRSELAEDEVMAALVARDGVEIDPAELARFCEGRLPYFAVPRYIDVLPDLPRTENGKVQKFKLRERGVGPQTWDGRPARA